MPILKATPKQLQSWLADNSAVVVDVREPAEFKSGHIEGAFNKPLSTVDVAEVNMPAHNHKKLVLHCQSGKRSTMAAEKLMAEDPALEVYNLEGGIVGWQEEGGAVRRSGRRTLPLDRQMQLTAGTLVALGVLLGVYVAKGWLVLPLFVGCGLMFAGITGWCGMMKLLSRMPWNKA